MNYTREQEPFDDFFILYDEDYLKKRKNDIKNDKTILHKQILEDEIDDVENLRILLKLGATNIFHKDEDGHTPISYGIELGSLKRIKLLLGYGFQNQNNEINVIRTILNDQHSNIGSCCIEMILEYSKSDISEEIIVVLGYYTYLGGIEIIELLLKYCDINFQDESGNTLLMNVIEAWLPHNNIEHLIHTMCSDYNANLNIKNNCGETVINLVKKYEDVDKKNKIVALFENYQKNK